VGNGDKKERRLREKGVDVTWREGSLFPGTEGDGCLTACPGMT